MAVSEDEVASWKLKETVEWALKQYNSLVAHCFEGNLALMRHTVLRNGMYHSHVVWSVLYCKHQCL